MLRFTYAAIQKSLEWKNRIGMILNPTENLGFVLTLHQVDYQSHWREAEYAITPSNFIKMIEMVTGLGLRFIAPDELAFPEKLDDRCVVMTFDDGFSGLGTHAFPFLIKSKIPFTLFITTGYIGKSGYLSHHEIETVLESGCCTLGAHSLTHPMLRPLSEVAASNEIMGSKTLLETRFGREVKYFAFPYGSVFAVSPANIRMVHESGFTLGFSTVKGCLNRAGLQNRYFLPRFNMNDETWQNIKRL